jgi:glycosyltransferase involved in cell wall biosynthesis
MFLSLGGIFPLRYGGPPVVAYNLVKEFDRKGLEVDLVFGISKKHSGEKKLPDILGFSKNVNLIPVIKNRRSPTSYETPFGQEFLRDTLRLARRLNNRLDLIHFCHIPSSKDFLIPVAASLKKIPTVINMHGLLTYELCIKKDRSVYPDDFSFKFFEKQFAKIVCNSNFMKRSIRTIFRVKSEKIEVIPNGVSLQNFRSATLINLLGEPALLYVGRLENEKGVEMLVRSMRHIVDLLPNAVLHIVGDGSLMKPLKDFVIRTDLKKEIVFHGYISSNLASFYKSADICLFPSVYESFGITVVEAMAAGKPIIVTKFGAIPEILQDQENGLLIVPNETNLFNAVSTLWNNKTLMNQISKNNLVKAKRFDWEKVAQRYIELYDNVM